MTVLYLLLAVIGLAAVLVYVLVIFREVPGAVAERWGELERLPDDLGQWQRDATSPEALAAAERGLVREVRTWRDPGAGWFGRDRLVLQARYKDPSTDEIKSVDPDLPLARRRVKPPAG